MAFTLDVLKLDPAEETERIVSALREQVRKVMRRYGGVIGISGGLDSSTVLALCAQAFGPAKVTAVTMPDSDSDPESETLARLVAERFNIEPILEDVTPSLNGFDCYRRRDEAIQRVHPEFDPEVGYKAKIVLPQDLLDRDSLNFFSVTIVDPVGGEITRRLPVSEYLQIVAASNFKQRARMATLYYHAEARNYAVIGTSNKNEFDQGFFVKYGDGGVDIQPIAHLYKTQVYQIAEYLGVPEEIRSRPPTTDTYSAHCTQEEFFFRLPFETMDLLWYAQENEIPIEEVSAATGFSETQIQRAYADFTRKARTTEYLRMAPFELT